MKKLIIIGASGFGKEVAWLAESTGEFEIQGYLDDNLDNDSLFYNKPVLGKVADAHRFKESSFVIAIGSPRIRMKVFKELEAQAINDFPNIISKKSDFSKTVIMGIGNVICSGTIITTDIAIGNFNIININSTIGHDSKLQDFVTIAPLAAISGNVTLETLTEIGTGSSIRQGLIMKTGSMLGMGGVLTKNIEENQIFVGNPATFLKSF